MSNKKIISIGFAAFIFPFSVFAQSSPYGIAVDQFGSRGGNNGGGWHWPWSQPQQQQPKYVPRRQEWPTFSFDANDIVRLKTGLVINGPVQVSLGHNSSQLISNHPNAQFLAQYDPSLGLYKITLLENQPSNAAQQPRPVSQQPPQPAHNGGVPSTTLVQPQGIKNPFLKFDQEKNQLVASSPWGIEAPVGVGATTIIKFSASWCPPCKILNKTIHDLKNPGFTLLEVDTDKAVASSESFDKKYLKQSIKEAEKLGIKKDVFMEMLSVGAVSLPTMVGVDSNGNTLGTVTGPRDAAWFGYAAGPSLRESELSDELPDVPSKDNSRPSPFSPKAESDAKPATVKPNAPAEVNNPENDAYKKELQLQIDVMREQNAAAKRREKELKNRLK